MQAQPVPQPGGLETCSGAGQKTNGAGLMEAQALLSRARPGEQDLCGGPASLLPVSMRGVPQNPTDMAI